MKIYIFASRLAIAYLPRRVLSEKLYPHILGA